MADLSQSREIPVARSRRMEWDWATKQSIGRNILLRLTLFWNCLICMWLEGLYANGLSLGIEGLCMLRWLKERGVVRIVSGRKKSQGFKKRSCQFPKTWKELYTWTHTATALWNWAGWCTAETQCSLHTSMHWRSLCVKRREGLS